MVDDAEMLTPGDAEEASRDGRRPAGCVVPFEEGKHTGPNLNAGFMAVAVV